ncbi:flap endonuclease-1, putative [Perkinsus marinus ATCC 50983]|uniref:Flap endonuclease-1, putative n=1 Tax=Perkinsus marinus (strain ATCC 50983 / TXsc) TaxID=423536 RepID=C5K6G8_PERM5|nr:flap endonuclease-1, putative [Perkinsus marinus ATCC 50983]EER19888.1 flap endonuclease-1, putative [Perkinsus marinus ATCC 50983]|eukprot:XP_002788092.1 flap endonuclease-1, putative [Perkinsus marinus ATCC 50983]
MGVNGLWATLSKGHPHIFTRIPLPPYAASNITHAKPSKIKQRHCLNQRWAVRTAYAAAALAKVEKEYSDEEETGGVSPPPPPPPAHVDLRLGVWWTCMWRNFFARGLSLCRAPDGWDAEAVCAKLAARCNGVVVSEDGDALAFGAPAILRNVWRYRILDDDDEPSAELVERAAVEEALGVTSRQFVEVCVLAGCDFASHLPNLGFTVASRAMREHKGIEEYLRQRELNDQQFRMIKLFALGFDWKAAVECFDKDMAEEEVRSLVRTDHDRAIAATCLLYGARDSLPAGIDRISAILNLCREAILRRMTNILEPTLDPEAFFADNPWRQQFAYLTFSHVCRKSAIEGGIFAARDGVGMKQYVGGKGRIFDRQRRKRPKDRLEMENWRMTRVFEPSLSLEDMPPLMIYFGPWRYRMAYIARREAEAGSILRSTVKDTEEVKRRNYSSLSSEQSAHHDDDLV